MGVEVEVAVAVRVGVLEEVGVGGTGVIVLVAVGMGDTGVSVRVDVGLGVLVDERLCCVLVACKVGSWTNGSLPLIKGRKILPPGGGGALPGTGSIDQLLKRKMGRTRPAKNK